MTIVGALKKLGKKLNTGGTEPTGTTIAAVLSSSESAFNINGEKGDDGAYVTAIELVTEDGAITGGTATLSDDTTVEITVTTAPAADAET